MGNTTKGFSESSSSFSDNETLKKVNELLGGKLDIGEMTIKAEKEGINNFIKNIIETNPKEKRLHVYLISEVDSDIFKEHVFLQKDLEISKLAIQQNPDLFFHVSGELKGDISLGKEFVKSMIRKNRSFSSIEKFIEKYHTDRKNEMYKFYYENLDRADNILKNDLAKNVIKLKDSNEALYNKLKEVGIINKNEKDIGIDPTFVKKYIDDCFKDDTFVVLNEQERQNYIKSNLTEIFGSEYSKLSSDEKVIYDLIINLFGVEISKRKNKDINSLVEEKKENKFEIADSGNNSASNDEEESGTEDDFGDIIDFSYPQCKTFPVSGGYNLETVTGKKIFISKSEKENFTSKALANYIKFYNTMHDLGLNFLWDKYSHGFKQLFKTRLDIDYVRGEGITESNTLGVLNLVGKNIGIPEKVVLDNSGKETNEYSCFKTLGDAKRVFKLIKETGVINGNKLSDGGPFSNGAVENMLILKECIDPKSGSLDTSNWK